LGQDRVLWPWCSTPARGPNADAALKAAGMLSEAQAGPFAALAKLKKGGRGMIACLDAA
jgi:hypothetical protein